MEWRIQQEEKTAMKEVGYARTSPIPIEDVARLLLESI
jgi:hypothetical protein